MPKTMVKFLLVALLATSCSSLQMKSSPPKPISSKPPESAIVLDGSAIAIEKGVTNVFPPGKYLPRYEDKGGYYFQAPGKVLVTDVASFGYDGGFYVERGKTEPAQWYIMGASGKTMGRFKPIPRYTIVH